MLLDRLVVDCATFAHATGWEVKDEGACRDGLCVPLPEAAVAGGMVDVECVADRLGMALVQDTARQVWALGPASATGGPRLTTLELPDLVLSDFDGAPFALRSLRGQKVVLINWASW